MYQEILICCMCFMKYLDFIIYLINIIHFPCSNCHSGGVRVVFVLISTKVKLSNKHWWHITRLDFNQCCHMSVRPYIKSYFVFNLWLDLICVLYESVVLCCIQSYEIVFLFMWVFDVKVLQKSIIESFEWYFA